MGKLIYYLFVKIYPIAIKFASQFDKKAALWVNGRKNLLQRIKEKVSENDKVIWMHCASLGEFEQGRPLLEKIKINYPAYKILLTFFSPSGYEVRKDYAGANYVFYLPMDGISISKNFLDIVSPKLIVFVKYEFWYYYLREAKRRNIPLLLVSAIFRSKQPFFKNHGAFHRKMLSFFSHVFVQNVKSVKLLRTIGFTANVSLSGDTRFDRVIEIAEDFQSISAIEAFCKDSVVVVAGSTWLADDKELAPYANSRKDVKFIIAPHDIRTGRIEECAKLYKRSTLFSSLQIASKAADVNTLIIDNIGMLSRLYKYATVNFIGGGFGKDGVHNVLEAAVYGKPVIYGPEYNKFNEAIELIEAGGGISIKNAQELKTIIDRLLQEPSLYLKKANASLQYVYSHQGATQKILTYIQEKRLLTN